MLTLFGSYLLFFILEGLDLQLSGILGICSMGYFLCGYSEMAISPLVSEPLSQIWDFIGFVAETLIYFLTGLIVGGSILQNGEITSTDWGLLIANFVLQYIARAIMIGMFYPIFKRTGYSINWKNFIVFVHSGLRGTVGLVLALTVYFDKEYSDRVRIITVFHLTGLAVLTVVFNGSTAKTILKILGLGRTTHEQEMAVSQAVKTLVNEVDKEITELMDTRKWDYVDWADVSSTSGLRSLSEDVLKKLTHGKKTLKRLIHSGSSQEEFLSEYEEVLSTVTEQNRISEARRRYLNIVKANYEHALREGQCSPETYVYLLGSVNRALDLTEVKISSLGGLFNVSKAASLADRNTRQES